MLGFKELSMSVPSLDDARTGRVGIIYRAIDRTWHIKSGALGTRSVVRLVWKEPDDLLCATPGYT